MNDYMKEFEKWLQTENLDSHLKSEPRQIRLGFSVRTRFSPSPADSGEYNTSNHKLLPLRATDSQGMVVRRFARQPER